MMGKAVIRWSSSMISTNIFIHPPGIAKTMLSVTWGAEFLVRPIIW